MRCSYHRRSIPSSSKLNHGGPLAFPVQHTKLGLGAMQEHSLSSAMEPRPRLGSTRELEHGALQACPEGRLTLTMEPRRPCLGRAPSWGMESRGPSPDPKHRPISAMVHEGWSQEK